MGISYLQAADERLKVIGRFPDPIELAVAAGHELATRERISLPDIAALLIAVVENDPIEATIRQAMAVENLRLKPLLTTNSVEAVRSFVPGGTGVSLLSRRTLEWDIRLGLAVSIPIDAPALSQASIEIMTRGQHRLPRIVRLFAEGVVAAVTRLG